MLIIKIISVGKNKEEWLDIAISEYQKRLSNKVSIEMRWVKDDEQLIELALKETSAIALDPQGKQLTSEGFATFVEKELEKGGSRLAFLIGGAEGLPQILRTKFPKIGLSNLTFTHQIARLVLIEQIYRSFEIMKGSPYHK